MSRRTYRRSTNVGGIREQLAGQLNSLLVDGVTSGSFYARIKYLIEQPDLRQSLSDALKREPIGSNVQPDSLYQIIL